MCVAVCMMIIKFCFALLHSLNHADIGTGDMLTDDINTVVCVIMSLTLNIPCLPS